MKCLKKRILSVSVALMAMAFAALTAFAAIQVEGTAKTPDQLPKGAYADVKALPEAIANKSVMIVDVRTPEEYESGHMNGAVSLPLGDALEKNLNTLPTDKPVVFYCFRGKRAAKAYNTAIQARPELEKNTHFLDATVTYPKSGDSLIQINK